MSIVTDYQNKLDYFTNLLGVKQVKLDEGIKWGYLLTGSVTTSNMTKAFIYLNTLSRYNPEGSNNITELQADFILTQLGKLLK